MAKFKIAHVTADVGTFGISTGLTGGLTSLTGDQIQPRVKIGAASEATGSILRAKGSRKFLVTDGATIQDESIVAGNMYMVSLVGTTNWQALGATANTVEVGHIFTATVSGAGLTTTGQVFAVGTCTLANSANGTLANDTMTITCTKADASTFRAKRITNKYVMDFSDNKFLVGSAGSAATDPDTVAVARA
jgi:hypothetical protein